MDLTKYTVVTSDDFGKFEDRVNQLLGEGWKLQGGVAAAALPDTDAGLIHVQWSQALVLPVRTAAGGVAAAHAQLYPAVEDGDLEPPLLDLDRPSL